jgi:nuclear transport factor 2 (NTF2) superfamily protein
MQSSIAQKDRAAEEHRSARMDSEAKLRMTEDALVAARNEIDAARTNRRESLTRKLQARQNAFVHSVPPGRVSV